ncbi:hypothetical protein ACJRO7_021783 [Eucalyptus globulus]|uniref:Uncharacterized protein n=1 Tax=Eucalyptus globulus TaxID=34317 RepID=A0ABD3KNG1_EUCGL
MCSKIYNLPTPKTEEKRPPSSTSCSECSPNAFALSEIPFVYVQEFLVCSAENSLGFTNLFARVARSSLKLAVQGLADGNGPKLFTAASDELSMANSKQQQTATKF